MAPETYKQSNGSQNERNWMHLGWWWMREFMYKASPSKVEIWLFHKLRGIKRSMCVCVCVCIRMAIYNAVGKQPLTLLLLNDDELIF